MPWDILIAAAQLALAALGLVWLGRLLRTARIYVAWGAFLYYGAAWAAWLGLLLLRWPSLAALAALRQFFEIVLVLGVAGCLLEHVRADRRRHADARRLLEQWRQASLLSRRRADELEVLAGITACLVASLDLRDVLAAVVDQARRLSGAEAVSVYLLDGETGTLRGQGVSAMEEPARVEGLPPPRAAGLTASVSRGGAPVFISDVAAHPLYQDEARPRLGAIAAVPLKVSGAVLGVLNVTYRRPRAFGEDERRMLLALADIAALAIHKAAQHERLARLAMIDDLTGLPNRRRFVEALRSEAGRARRYQRALSLLMLDLDGLKTVNDQHGHAAGDAVLRAVAQVLRANTRETDLAARLSGDEFAVLLPETEPDAALRIAERIREGAAGARVPVGGGHVGATVSVGLASGAGAALPDLPRFLKLADEALYAAKAAGRNATVAAPGPAPARPAASVTSR